MTEQATPDSRAITQPATVRARRVALVVVTSSTSAGLFQYARQRGCHSYRDSRMSNQGIEGLTISCERLCAEAGHSIDSPFSACRLRC